MKILFLTPNPEQAAITRYRVLQFIPFLANQGIEADVRPFIPPYLYKIKNDRGLWRTVQKTTLLLFASIRRIKDILLSPRYDVVFVQREAFPFLTPLFERMVQALNPNMVFDFDDAIFTSPTHNPNWRDVLRNPGRVADVVRQSALVIAGNDYLREYAEQFSSNVVVIPTVLDTRRYRIKQHTNLPTVTIGWIGGWSTLGSLKDLESVFSSLAERYDLKVKVVGAKNIDSFRPQNVTVEHKLWNLSDEIADLHSFDIGVMPLPDNEWERGKCGFKLLQYMAVGVPAVASPVGVNIEIVEDGKSGLLANNEQEWVENLGRLIEDPSLRKQIGLQGRRVVEERFSLEHIAPKFVSLLNETGEK